MWALALLVFAAPFLFGGMRWDHQTLLCGLAFLVFTLCAWSRLGARFGFPWPLIGPAVLVALGLFQLLPLPSSVLASLSPAADEILRHSLGDLGLYGDGQPRPLSLSPPLTWIATWHQAAFVGVAWAASNLPRGRSVLIERAVAFSGALAVLVGLAHWGLGADQIYGFYVRQSQASLTGFFGPFVNENTFGGLLVLSAFVGLGLAIESRSIRGRRLASTSAALCALGIFLTGSRGAQAALFLSAIAFAFLSHLPKEAALERGRARAVSRGVLALALVVLLLGIVLQRDWHLGLIENPTHDSKVAAWPAAVEHARAFFGFGSGRGTFRVVHPLFQSANIVHTIAYPENIILQLASEWGVLGAVLATALAGAGLIYCARKAEHRPRQVALVAGLLGVSAQQLVDFGFEAAGLSLPVAAIFGVCLARARRGREAVRQSAAARPGRLALVAVVLGLTFATLLALKAPSALAALPQEAYAAVRAATAEDLDALARRRVADLPADGFLAELVAERLAGAPNPVVPDALRWFNRAMKLQPTEGRPHLSAARFFVRFGRFGQAAGEYRLAIGRLPWQRNALVAEVARRFNDPELRVTAMPDDAACRLSLARLMVREAAKTQGDELSFETLNRLVAEHPADLPVLIVRAAMCLSRGDLPCALADAAALEAGGRELPAALLRARLALRAQRPEDARRAVEIVRTSDAHETSALLQAAEIYGELGDLPAAIQVLKRLWPHVALRPETAATVLAMRAQLELRLDTPGPALEHFLRAYEQFARPAYAAGARRAALKLGRPADADAVLKKARERFPSSRLLWAKPPATPSDPSRPFDPSSPGDPAGGALKLDGPTEGPQHGTPE